MSNYQQERTELEGHFLGEDPQAALVYTQEVLDGGVEALTFFDEIFSPAMEAVGDKFGRLDIFLPELIEAAERAKAVSDQILKPIFAESGGGGEARGKVAICSVQGDLHDIGKNMVALMLQVNGFDVIDLGINVPPKEALNRARDEEADILGLSSLMTTSMPYMKECVEMRDGFGMKDQFSVIVGGAPITAGYAADIGADAFGKDAIQAVEQCLALMDRPFVE
jgi:methylmalonyl-CoA mutase cobalamin-binding domain/chain